MTHTEAVELYRRLFNSVDVDLVEAGNDVLNVAKASKVSDARWLLSHWDEPAEAAIDIWRALGRDASGVIICPHCGEIIEPHSTPEQERRHERRT